MFILKASQRRFIKGTKKAQPVQTRLGFLDGLDVLKTGFWLLQYKCSVIKLRFNVLKQNLVGRRGLNSCLPNKCQPRFMTDTKKPNLCKPDWAFLMVLIAS